MGSTIHSKQPLVLVLGDLTALLADVLLFQTPKVNGIAITGSCTVRLVFGESGLRYKIPDDCGLLLLADDDAWCLAFAVTVSGKTVS